MAATWLMMSVEGPFLAAVIARLPLPKFNLAAYGVAFSFALIVEAPIIMLMSGFILFDTSRIARGEETNYIMATYGIYLSIFNIFISLLQLLGIFGDE